jgi:hypothetical protein
MGKSSVIDKINIISEEINVKPNPIHLKMVYLMEQLNNPNLGNIAAKITTSDNPNLGNIAATITTSDTKYDTNGENLGETNRHSTELINIGDSFEIVNKSD